MLLSGNWAQLDFFGVRLIILLYFSTVEDSEALQFHDVDVCRRQYSMSYGVFFGIVFTIRPHMFRRINGFPIVYFGWGGEDDDMSLRYSIVPLNNISSLCYLMVSMSPLTWLSFFSRADISQDHSRALQACIFGPPKDWRRRVGRSRQTWLRTVEDDLRPLNFGLATARRHAMDRSAWQQYSWRRLRLLSTFQR